MTMLSEPRFLETPNEGSMYFPIDLDTHDELQETRGSPSPPTYEERMANHLRRRRSICPEPEDLECVEIPAAEFYRAKKRIKTVDSKLEDRPIPDNRPGGLIETVQRLLQGPTDLGSLKLSSGKLPSGNYTGGFTAINRDWPSSWRTLSSPKENSIPGTKTGGSTSSDQERQTTPRSTLRSAEQVAISGIQTVGFTAINRDWPSYKTLRTLRENRVSGSQIGGPSTRNEEWQAPDRDPPGSSEGMSSSPIQTSGIIETNGVGVAAIVNTSVRRSKVVHFDETNRPIQVIDLTSPEKINSLVVKDCFSTLGKYFESLSSDGGISTSGLSADSYSDREPAHETGRFQGTTFNYPRTDALQHALQEQNFPISSDFDYRLVLWADGSGDKGKAADAVSWRVPEDPEVWKIRARRLPWVKDSLVTELYAIAHGLEVAIEQITSHQNGNPTHVRYEVLVFSDCVGAIERLGENRGAYRFRIADDKPITQIITRSAQLRLLKVNLEVHWVPGHVGVLGNELSDLAAGRVARAKAINIALRLPRWIEPWEARESLRLAISRL